MQRLSVRYSGRVQGVGFRATVADIARHWKVCGRVANVADGTVDLQAEGDEPELIGFQQAILERLNRHIVNHHTQWSEVEQPSWERFGIGSDLPR